MCPSCQFGRAEQRIERTSYKGTQQAEIHVHVPWLSLTAACLKVSIRQGCLVLTANAKLQMVSCLRLLLDRERYANKDSVPLFCLILLPAVLLELLGGGSRTVTSDFKKNPGTAK